MIRRLMLKKRENTEAAQINAEGLQINTEAPQINTEESQVNAEEIQRNIEAECSKNVSFLLNLSTRCVGDVRRKW
ncbi:hypothetical protein [Allobacillus saliphilus]|nr:hypothetical protein [Allobacillus saliphilus]